MESSAQHVGLRAAAAVVAGVALGSCLLGANRVLHGRGTEAPAKPAPMDTVAVGARLLPFDMQGRGDRRIRSSDMEGREYTLVFAAVECGPCQAVMGLLGKGAAVDQTILVLLLEESDAPEAQMAAVAARWALSIPVAWMRLQTARALHGVEGVPMAYTIGADGRVARLAEGDGAVVRLLWEQQGGQGQ